MKNFELVLGCGFYFWRSIDNTGGKHCRRVFFVQSLFVIFVVLYLASNLGEIHGSSACHQDFVSAWASGQLQCPHTHASLIRSIE